MVLIHLSPFAAEMFPAIVGLFVAVGGYALARYTVRGRPRRP